MENNTTPLQSSVGNTTNTNISQRNPLQMRDMVNMIARGKIYIKTVVGILLIIFLFLQHHGVIEE